eukprot:NODE_64_length_3583_cov_45.923699_g60_i0.p1 GENE.NODE_64_length_3583_cov_45.923699_g60_i0~~NODE_64_length_3583_cov_45.923699_g60_i0.p1  ORF type:complete len:887 (+),score=172.14 NODE_64_length_3583_cov_45.923699_g60_i0:53-2713(+)
MPKPKTKLSLNSFIKGPIEKDPAHNAEELYVTLRHPACTCRMAPAAECFCKKLPVILFVNIYSFLGHHDVKQAGRVNRALAKVAANQGLWHCLFLNKVNDVWEGESWKRFFGHEDKHTDWRKRFKELEKSMTRDESFYCIKVAHHGCVDQHTVEERKSRILPITGVNNLIFAVQGTETIPASMLFSSSRPTQSAPATLKVWSVGQLSQAPSPLADTPFDLLHRGPIAGQEGMVHPSAYSVHQLASRDIGNELTKMFPVYTYYKEGDNVWEYACIGGDEAGQVSFYTGSCNGDNGASCPPSNIFRTDGKVVGLKCLLEERGFSGFKQAFGCGFNDSGHLYDLQTNTMLADFPHDPHTNTDTVDVTVDGTHFVLGQVLRKNQQQQGLIKLFQMTPSGPQETATCMAAPGPVKCVRFSTLNGVEAGDAFVFTTRDGLSIWDKRVGKAQLKYPTNAPLDQFCVVASRAMIAATTGPDMLLWDMRGARAIKKVAHCHSWCSSITCDATVGKPTSNMIITGGTDGGIRFWHINQLWKANQGEEVRRRGGGGGGFQPRQEDGGRGFGRGMRRTPQGGRGVNQHNQHHNQNGFHHHAQAQAQAQAQVQAQAQAQAPAPSSAALPTPGEAHGKETAPPTSETTQKPVNRGPWNREVQSGDLGEARDLRKGLMGTQKPTVPASTAAPALDPAPGSPVQGQQAQATSSSQAYRPPRTAPMMVTHTTPPPQPGVPNWQQKPDGFNPMQQQQMHHHQMQMQQQTPMFGAIPPNAQEQPATYPHHHFQQGYAPPPPPPFYSPYPHQPPAQQEMGQEMHHQHGYAPPPPPGPSVDPASLCIHFQRGTCMFDSRCRWRHILGNGYELPTSWKSSIPPPEGQVEAAQGSPTRFNVAEAGLPPL